MMVLVCIYIYHNQNYKNITVEKMNEKKPSICAYLIAPIRRNDVLLVDALTLYLI